MNVTHRQLKAFLLVASHRNFSRAAEQMFIAQSGLSLMIRELEEQLGFRLFDRTTRNVQLTSLGTQFLPVAQQNVQNIEGIVSRLGQSARSASLTLTIGAPPMTSSYLLPELIAFFNKSHPEVRVRVVDTDISNISSLVRGGEIDMGLGMFIKPTPGVERIPLFRFSLVVASADHSFNVDHTPMPWHDLLGKPIIGLPPENPLQQFIDKQMASVGGLAPPDFVVNFIDTQLGMVAAGCGVAVIPSTAISACQNRKVRLNVLSEPAIELDFYEVRDRSRQLPSCAESFTALLQRSISESHKPLRAT